MRDRYVKLGVVAAAAALVASGSTAANAADRITFGYQGFAQPASGALASGEYSVDFLDPNNESLASGTMTRNGTVIDTGRIMDVTLLPGDVATLFDSRVEEGRGVSATFTGYPTIDPVHCGSLEVSGLTAPGSPAEEVTDGYGSRGGGEMSKHIVNSGGGYTATFIKPIPPGAILEVTSWTFGPPIEVVIQSVAQALAPCLPATSGTSGPPASTTKCIVPNLRHKSLAQARKLLARAHCRLGKILVSRKRTHHKPVVISQRPQAKKSLAAGSKVSVRLR